MHMIIHIIISCARVGLKGIASGEAMWWRRGGTPQAQCAELGAGQILHRPKISTPSPLSFTHYMPPNTLEPKP